MNVPAPLILVRGLPGSGKTTFANELARALYGSAEHYETDDFFVSSTNSEDYKFDPSMLGLAHNWNIARTYMTVRDFPRVPVIVANTFTTRKELEPYVAIGKKFGRKIVVVEMTNDVFAENTKFKNVHGVPTETLRKMEKRREGLICPQFMDGIGSPYYCSKDNLHEIVENILDNYCGR